ncbi:MAG: epoxyqueuosine reductase QueH [Candidatus Buchananbacteria bacterium]
MAKEKLLFHVCCAPCSGLLSQQLMGDYDITVYFDNPNIWPAEEFSKRAEEAEKYFASQGVKFVLTDWDHGKWLELIRGLEREPERGRRCQLCYHHRLENSAKYAVGQGFDCFVTSLGISPYKDGKIIRNLGRMLAEKYGLKYLADDFKASPGYAAARQFAKDRGFYRQKYCGCEYSKKGGKI